MHGPRSGLTCRLVHNTKQSTSTNTCRCRLGAQPALAVTSATPVLPSQDVIARMAYRPMTSLPQKLDSASAASTSWWVTFQPLAEYLVCMSFRVCSKDLGETAETTVRPP